MDQKVREAWIFPAAILALVVWLHWRTYRVKKPPERSRALSDVGGIGAASSKVRRISNDPVEPE
jgi:hypothetical protein